MNTFWIKSALLVSAVCSGILLCLICKFFYHYIRRWVFGKMPAKSIPYRSFRSRLLRSSVLMLFAVWSLRFSVGYYASFHRLSEIDSLTPTENIFNSLVHAFQTFSMDEAYTEYISAGKAMIEDVFSTGTVWADIYGVYAAILNFMVPIAGGAILFEMICEFYPKLQLCISTLFFRTVKIYFSELNDNSLALAKSIIDFKCNIHIIFTDSYRDDEEENSSERMTKARALGAICIKDDLQHIKFRGRLTKIFLIDSSENSNLQTLTEILERGIKKVNKVEIYVFSADNKFSHLDEEISFIVNKTGMRQYELLSDEQKIAFAEKYRAGLDDNARKEYDTELTEADRHNACLNSFVNQYIVNNIPAVLPVNGVRNLAADLFTDVPLYEPIIDKPAGSDGKKDLNLTIFGSGIIGTEIFLTAYWCGQMLNTRLNIKVVSKEKKDSSDTAAAADKQSFEGHINYINPDILGTSVPDPDLDLLKYCEDGSCSEPYFDYEYIEADVMANDFGRFLDSNGLLDTDYFVIALGSDEENFSVADRLRQAVGAHHLFRSDNRKAVISYVIYNSDLALSLNKSNMHKYSTASDSPDILMYAFGDLESVYSVRNVFFNGPTDKTFDLGMQYDSRKRGFNEEAHKKTKEKRFKDIYSHQANLSKDFHKKYREYSAGFHKVSIFTATDPKEQCRKTPEENYIRFITMDPADKKLGNGRTKMELVHSLAWLEHRRWCAFLRIKGFRRPDETKKQDFAQYYFKYLPEHSGSDHKFISLKLHPCLVECSKQGINAEFGKYGFVYDHTEFSSVNAKPDLLDSLSLKRHELNSKSEDFKRWDYPEFELTEEEKATHIVERPDLKTACQTFKTSFADFTSGLGRFEGSEHWDSSSRGSITAYYTDKLVYLIVRQLAPKGDITAKTAEYLGSLFGISRTAEELAALSGKIRSDGTETLCKELRESLDLLGKVSPGQAESCVKVIGDIDNVFTEVYGLFSNSLIRKVMTDVCEKEKVTV